MEHHPQLRFLQSLCGMVHTWGLKLNDVIPYRLFSNRRWSLGLFFSIRVSVLWPNVKSFRAYSSNASVDGLVSAG